MGAAGSRNPSAQVARKGGAGLSVMTDHHFQRAALHFLSFARINVMPRRQNHRPRRQHFRLPVVRKAQIDGWLRQSPRSWLRLVLQNPAPLLLCVRYMPSARVLNRCQCLLWLPTQMDQHARRRHRGPADASPAMHADPVSRSEDDPPDPATNSRNVVTSAGTWTSRIG